MKIGILGGTFDPPHLGHLALAEAAMAALELDEVIFMPAYRNPLKEKRRTTPARHRIAMVERMVADHPNFAVSDLETGRGGPSYAVDTMAELQYVRPAEYWFILGADALKTLPEWKQPERLLRLCRLAVTSRAPLSPAEALMRIPAELREHVDVFEMKPADISASEIRNKLAAGQSVSLWVPKPVIQYIQEQKLYRIT